MWTIKKILVPPAFSKPAELALEAAITLARKFDAAIVLMHAYQVPVYPYAFAANAMVTPNDLVEHIEKAAQTALETAAASHGACGIRIDTTLKTGTPWEQI